MKKLKFCLDCLAGLGLEIRPWRVTGQTQQHHPRVPVGLRVRAGRDGEGRQCDVHTRAAAAGSRSRRRDEKDTGTETPADGGLRGRRRRRRRRRGQAGRGRRGGRHRGGFAARWTDALAPAHVLRRRGNPSTATHRHAGLAERQLQSGQPSQSQRPNRKSRWTGGDSWDVRLSAARFSVILSVILQFFPTSNS